MFKPLFSGLFVLVLIFSAPPARADDSFTDAQKKELEALFKDYLLNHGDVVMDGMKAYQVAEKQKELDEIKKNVLEYKDSIYDPASPSTGPDDADVTVVEFFDYNCGYCKRALKDVQSILQDDPNVRFIFKDIPILSPASVKTAKWALAAGKQDRYFDYHSALLSHNGQKDDQVFKTIGADLGLDIEKLENDSKSTDVAAMLAKNLDTSAKIGIHATPSFIIGDYVVVGYVPAEEMKRMIEQTRKKDE